MENQEVEASHSTKDVPSSRRRRISTSLKSKLPFLPQTAHNLEESHKGHTSHGVQDNSFNKNEESQSSPASTRKQTRPRKGSLRKVALLGTRAIRIQQDQQSLIDVQESDRIDDSQEKSSPKSGEAMHDVEVNTLDIHNIPVQTTPGPVHKGSSRSTPDQGIGQQQRLSVPGKTSKKLVDSDSLPAPTDERRDVVSVAKPGRSSPRYRKQRTKYRSVSSTFRKRSAKEEASILTQPSGSAPLEDWDYSSTEWWGWMILTATWAIFVMGMGSCFGVWSWAWDVGEKPSAPPEFEDDPSLPIIGYYPALIILTGVMAWVWVVIAWVGMKYFRHAKI